MTDPAKPGVSHVLGGSGHLVEKVTAERVVRVVDGAVRFANELRDEMQVAGRGEELGNRPELPVGVDLLQGSLGQSSNVLVILLVGSRQDHLPGAPDSLLCDLGVLLSSKDQSIPPLLGLVVVSYRHVDRQVGGSPRRQATHLAHSPASGDRRL